MRRCVGILLAFTGSYLVWFFALKPTGWKQSMPTGQHLLGHLSLTHDAREVTLRITRETTRK